MSEHDDGINESDWKSIDEYTETFSILDFETTTFLNSQTAIDPHGIRLETINGIPVARYPVVTEDEVIYPEDGE